MGSKVPAAIIIVVLIAVVPAGSVETFGADRDLTPEHRGTLLDMALLERGLALHREMHGSLGEPADDWTEAAAIARVLDPVFVDTLPAFDRWGQPILVRQRDAAVLVLSSGPDGVVDDMEELERVLAEPRFRRSAFKQVRGDDILVMEGEVLIGPAPLLERVRTTAADIRTIAVALHAFCIDQGHFPPVPPGINDVGILREFIEPIYLREVPCFDAWGRQLMVRIEPTTFLIASFGADGSPGAQYGSVEMQSLAGHVEYSTDPSSDIVYLLD